MPPLDPALLPDDLRALIGQPVPEGTCWTEQPVCHPDPRVTAQLVDTEPVEQVTPWRIRNADAGDMLLTPGGPAGFIGEMLGALSPPERYSHMGIFIEDGTTIRHCTTSEEVLKRFPHKADNIIAGASRTIAPDSLNEAPTDGFEENHLRFQWPGTITQTIEAACLSARNWGDEATPYKVRNDELGEDFRIAALTFKPVPFPAPDGEVTLVHPMLVKTCLTGNFSDAQRKAILDARARVVRYVKDMRCHYRFFSYTRADIGLAEDGPATLEATTPVFAPGCTGVNSRVDTPTARTGGAQCASLIWLAVQKANADAASGVSPAARITLDASTIDVGFNPLCEEPSYLPQTVDGADRDLPQGGRTSDGLYLYTEKERQDAAKTLYNALHENVLTEIKTSVALQQAFDDATEGDVGAPLWVVFNLLNAGIPLLIIPGLLGITDEVLRTLVRFFSDIPDDVASQTANAFASDDCSQDAKDSDAYEKPGIGETISPDGIYRHWSPPALVDPGERVVGLWGRNVVAGPPIPPLRVKGPAPSTWQIAPGEADIIRSKVERDFEGQRIPVPGAIVRIGCHRMVTNGDGMIPYTRLPAGIYWAEAWWDEPVTGIRYADPGKALTINDGEAFQRNFLLSPPPDSLRAVWLHVHMDNVNRKMIGKDWWDHPDYTTDYQFVGPDLANPVLEVTFNDGRQIDDWGRSEFIVVAQLVTKAPVDPEDPPQWSLLVTWKIRINEEDEDDPWREKGTFVVPPKPDPLAPGTTVSDNLSRLDVFPVRSHVRITVHNDRA